MLSNITKKFESSKEEGTTQRLLDENLVENFMELSGVQEVASFNNTSEHIEHDDRKSSKHNEFGTYLYGVRNTYGVEESERSSMMTNQPQGYIQN